MPNLFAYHYHDRKEDEKDLARDERDFPIRQTISHNGSIGSWEDFADEHLGGIEVY